MLFNYVSMKHFEKKIKQDPDVLYGYEVPALQMY